VCFPTATDHLHENIQNIVETMTIILMLKSYRFFPLFLSLSAFFFLKFNSTFTHVMLYMCH